MTNKQFSHYYPLYLDSIEAIARKFAKRDEDLFDDLCQEGRLALLGFVPEAVHSNEKACVCQAIRNRLIDYMRRDRAELRTSLTTMLDAGDQLVVENGDPRIVSRYPHKNCFRNLYGSGDDYGN